MARPLSDEKRSTIIEAATESVALLGTGASTAKIAIAAGVSEGTIFTYFPTKDELLNALYLEIKGDLAKAMLDTYPATASLLDRTRHVWDAYTAWGHGQPTKRKAMQQLVVSEKITRESRKLGVELFEVVNALLAESISTNPLQERAAIFNGSLLESVATTTLDFMAKEPGEARRYRDAGFSFFWNGLK
jgi:AcrR family transcriptional regulator